MAINCVIPGGQRCGSTFLYKLISNFDTVRNPIRLNSEPKWFLKSDTESADYKLYMKEVFGVEGHYQGALYLEKSTSYFVDENAASRIMQVLGRIPIVVIIRNPVERAISHFRFSKQNGFENLYFHKAIYLNPDNRSYAKGKISSNPFKYIENGLYFYHLQRWLLTFPEMKVVFLEDLIKEPSAFIEICEYLGLDRNLAEYFWNSQRVNQGNFFPEVIGIREIEHLQSTFLEPNMMLQELLGRDLPPEWFSPIYFDISDNK
jgi:hypothetical protein